MPSNFDHTRLQYWVLGSDGRTPTKVSQEEYAAWPVSFDILTEPRLVARTEIAGHEVSTVFIPRITDPEIDGETPSWFFETHVIHRGRHRDAGRYSTWDDAYRGHLEAVEKTTAELREKRNAR